MPSKGGWRNECGADVLNGKLYAAGGEAENHRFLDTAERFDPVAGKWEQIAYMPFENSRLELVCCGEFLYAIGGVSNPKALQKYDPSLDRWTMAASTIFDHPAPGATSLSCPDLEGVMQSQ